MVQGRDIQFQWKTNRKWYVIYRIVLFTVSLSDLEKLFQLPDTSLRPVLKQYSSTAHIAYEINYNDRLSYCFTAVFEGKYFSRLFMAMSAVN